jgi:hypothetical protein
VLWVQAGGGAEGTADQHFVTSYSLDGAGTQWSLPTRLREVGGDGFALWGPTLFADKIQQRLWLVYSQNTGACHSNYMHWCVWQWAWRCRSRVSNHHPVQVPRAAV